MLSGQTVGYLINPPEPTYRSWKFAALADPNDPNLGNDPNFGNGITGDVNDVWLQWDLDANDVNSLVEGVNKIFIAAQSTELFVWYLSLSDELNTEYTGYNGEKYWDSFETTTNWRPPRYKFAIRLLYYGDAPYHYCGEPGTAELPGDFNQDCYVNLKDLSRLAGQWLECTEPDVPGCTNENL